jgi:hypothetical protein
MEIAENPLLEDKRVVKIKAKKPKGGNKKSIDPIIEIKEVEAFNKKKRGRKPKKPINEPDPPIDAQKPVPESVQDVAVEEAPASTQDIDIPASEDITMPIEKKGDSIDTALHLDLELPIQKSKRKYTKRQVKPVVVDSTLSAFAAMDQPVHKQVANLDMEPQVYTGDSDYVRLNDPNYRLSNGLNDFQEFHDVSNAPPTTSNGKMAKIAKSLNKSYVSNAGTLEGAGIGTDPYFKKQKITAFESSYLDAVNNPYTSLSFQTHPQFGGLKYLYLK